MKRFFLTLAALSVCTAAPAAAQGFQVIVHADNPVATIGKSELSGIFFKKSTKFPGGKAATPVDQEKSAAARDAFSKAVHGRAVTAVTAFWQQQIFAGQDVPPAEKGDDADVIAFVKSNPSAIGYVSAGATLGAGVKAVAIK
jgi:ABC-type phosphate transport system substrate-binding protein